MLRAVVVDHLPIQQGPYSGVSPIYGYSCRHQLVGKIQSAGVAITGDGANLDTNLTSGHIRHLLMAEPSAVEEDRWVLDHEDPAGWKSKTTTVAQDASPSTGLEMRKYRVSL